MIHAAVFSRFLFLFLYIDMLSKELVICTWRSWLTLGKGVRFL